jgi:hypothetical protein
MRRVVRTSMLALLAVPLTVAAPAVTVAHTDTGVAAARPRASASAQVVAAGWPAAATPSSPTVRPPRAGATVTARTGPTEV